jgi:hypothetical protein
MAYYLIHYTHPAAVNCNEKSQKKPSGHAVQVDALAPPFENVPRGHGKTVPFPGQ